VANGLDVKIRKSGLTIGDVVLTVFSKWNAFYPDEPLIIRNRAEIDMAQVLDGDSPRIDFELEDRAGVWCIFFYVGEVSGFEREEDMFGLFAGLTNWRNRDSVLLMAIAAAAVAELMGADILDDALEIAMGNVISVQALNERLDAVKGMSFSGAAKVFAPNASYPSDM